MKCYLSGFQGTNEIAETQLIEAGVIERCYSYVYVSKVPGLPTYTKGFAGAYKASVGHNVDIMMDSGVFSYRSYKKKLIDAGKPLGDFPTDEEFIRLYVKWVKANQDKWGFCVTLDFGFDAAANFERHKRLLKMGIRPIPVFHGDASIDYVRRYKEELGHDFIGLGGVTWRGRSIGNKSPVLSYSASKYISAMFNAGERYGVKFHGLAITSAALMYQWPFYSVDSSTWSRQAGYGILMRLDPVRRKITYLHVSTREVKGINTSYKSNSKAVAKLKEEIEADGYNFEELQTSYLLRHVHNVRTMKALTVDATKMHGGSGARVKLKSLIGN